MNATQEPKYEIKDGKLHNRQSGKPIPDDEPVMIFRAKDKNAVHAIAYYLGHCNGTHAEAVGYRLHQFERWATEHSERMKEPDTELTAEFKNLTQ